MLLNGRRIFALTLGSLLICLLSFAPGYGVVPQKQDKTEKKKQKEEKKKDKQASAATGDAHPVLWQEPTDIESRDLFNGPGGAEGTRTASSPSRSGPRAVRPRRFT